MKQVLTLLVLISFIYSATAQTSRQDQKVKEFLEISGAGKMGAQMAKEMIANFQKSFSTVPSEFWEKVKAEINGPDLINMLVPVYSKYYTESELDELIKFYKTPIGQKVLAVTPEIMRESMQLGQSWGRKIADKIIKELTEKGYKPQST